MSSDPIYTTESKRELYEALLDAFRSRDDLYLMVDLYLNLNLNRIVAENKNLEQTVLALITYVDKQSRRRDLLIAARKANKDNEQLHALEKRVGLAPRAVRIRRQAFDYPVLAVAVLSLIGIAFAGSAGAVLASRLEPSAVRNIELVIALIAASIVVWLTRVWRLQLHMLVVPVAAVATVAGTLALPQPGPKTADPLPLPAESTTLTGRVFYEGSNEPVGGVSVIISGRSWTDSVFTSSDGAFVLRDVPASARFIEAQKGSGAPVKFEITKREGADYRIPRPPPAWTSSSVAISTSAWTSMQSNECAQPANAFALRTTIPALRDAQTHLEVELPSGWEFVNAMSRNRTSTPTKIAASERRRRGWDFSPQEGPIVPSVEVCILSDSAGAPQASVLSTSYWHTR